MYTNATVSHLKQYVHNTTVVHLKPCIHNTTVSYLKQCVHTTTVPHLKPHSAEKATSFHTPCHSQVTTVEQGDKTGGLC